jgi:hypothetical protein
VPLLNSGNSPEPPVLGKLQVPRNEGNKEKKQAAVISAETSKLCRYRCLIQPVSARFMSGGKVPGTHWIGGSVARRSSTDLTMKRNKFRNVSYQFRSVRSAIASVVCLRWVWCSPTNAGQGAINWVPVGLQPGRESGYLWAGFTPCT